MLTAEKKNESVLKFLCNTSVEKSKSGAFSRKESLGKFYCAHFFLLFRLSTPSGSVLILYILMKIMFYSGLQVDFIKLDTELS